VRFVPDLDNQPIGEVAATDGDAGSRIGQTSAQTPLNSGPGGIVPPDHGVRQPAVPESLRVSADDLAAETREVAWSGDRGAVRVGDEGSYTPDSCEQILEALKVGQVEQVLESNTLDGVQWLSERQDALFKGFLRSFTVGDVPRVQYMGSKVILTLPQRNVHPLALVFYPLQFGNPAPHPDQFIEQLLFGFLFVLHVVFPEMRT